MGATEDAVYELARGRGIRLERQARIVGLSSRGHLDSGLRAYASEGLIAQLAEMFDGLGGAAVRLAAKRASPLRLDFSAPDYGVFVEVDETQHFTTERGATLAFYGDSQHECVDGYRSLVDEWSSTADRYRASKQAVDFPRFGGRRAQRAYLDAVRDLGALELGARLIRIPAPERDAKVALARLESALTTV